MKKERNQFTIGPVPHEPISHYRRYPTRMETGVWTERYPGRWYRYEHEGEGHRMYQFFCCMDCRQDLDRPFAVVPELRQQVMDMEGGQYAVICVSCFEQRLGRPFEREDLLDSPANEGLLP